MNEHTGAKNWSARLVEWRVWRKLVDDVITHPELLQSQITERQSELLKQGDSLDSDIAKARQRLTEIEQEQAYIVKQAARGMIDEPVFDALINDNRLQQADARNALEQLITTRDNAAKVQQGINFAYSFLDNIRERLLEIDQPPKELEKLEDALQRKILTKRQTIVRALCDKITINQDGGIKIDGVIQTDIEPQIDGYTNSYVCSFPWGSINAHAEVKQAVL